MPKPNVKALAIWYADGRRDAAESYDADDFDLDKLAVVSSSGGEPKKRGPTRMFCLGAAFRRWRRTR
jgi:hypothetical protein